MNRDVLRYESKFYLIFVVNLANQCDIYIYIYIYDVFTRAFSIGEYIKYCKNCCGVKSGLWVYCRATISIAVLMFPNRLP